MATIVRDAVIAAPPAHCWDAVRSFSALHERLARGFVTAVTMVGERKREVTFFSGAVATEMLVGIDDHSMRLAYTVVDGPLHAAHYNASAQVVPHGAQRCRFVWTIDVLPDELASRTAELMEAGLRAIRTTLDGRTAGAARAGTDGFRGLLERYVAAWNEPDADKRLTAVQNVWDERGTCVNAIAEYCGWQEVATAVTRSFDSWVSGGYRFRQARAPVSHHNTVRFAWEMVGPDGGSVISTGTNFLVLSEQGRILSDHQFADA